jgi:amino acid adenylation domain-containing protein
MKPTRALDAAAMPRSDLIHETIRARAAEQPGAAALRYPGGTVTYGELNRTSDDLAAVLGAAGIGPGTIVPVLLPPSALLAFVLLAVLKCGAAYAAVDTAWPEERMRRIARLLPGQIAVGAPGTRAHYAGQYIAVGEDGSAVIDAVHRPPRIVPTDGAAAMVFFTSGSTGEPKAVLSPHRAISRLFSNCTFARFDHTTVMAQIAAVPWDAFAMELWGPLLTGGTCALVTERPLTPAGLREVITAHGVNTVFLTTSLFHLIVEEDLTAFAGLHTVVAGGEKMSAAHAGQFLHAWPDLRLVNGYGPVESAVFALTHDVRPVDQDGDIPLGLPVPRTQVMLMRRGEQIGERCAPDEVGEICIAGDGLAIGYIGDAGLTAEKFVTAVIDGRPVRLYRTGDLGRLGADEVVHFHGRLDRQVKIRGHRLEPAGIEHLAGEVPGVRRCVVLTQRNETADTTGLTMFYLPTSGHPTEPELTTALRAGLPAYSVPDRIVAVGHFPLSANGKLDTEALLAAWAAPPPGRASAVAAGADGTEGIVATEASTLLGLAGVDRSASLFTQGGTSLTAVRLCSRLGQRFQRAIPVSQLMRDPTVAGLAAWLDTLSATPQAAAPEPSDGAPLTPMQQSFVLEHLRSGSDLANHCMLSWTITGPLAPARLAAAVADVHHRHGYLRARFQFDDDERAIDSGIPVQFIQLTADDSGRAARLLAECLSRPFDLEGGLVWRAVLVRDRGRGQWLFGVAVHHAAFDGWSEHLLARELTLAYSASAHHEPVSPAVPVPTPAQTYGLLAELTVAVDLAAQRAFWAQALAGTPPIAWPTAAGRDDTQPRSIEYALGGDVLAAISLAAQRQGVTLLTILLDGVYQAVSAHTGQDDFGVGVPVSIRGTEPLQRPIGCLIDTVCVRLRWAPDRLAATAAAVTGALANADVPFAEVVRLVRPHRTGRHPIYQVIAAIQDSPVPLLKLTDCRTEIRQPQHIPWPDAELVLELFTAPGAPARLRVSRNPAVVDWQTLSSVAERVLGQMRSVVEIAGV